MTVSLNPVLRPQQRGPATFFPWHSFLRLVLKAILLLTAPIMKSPVFRRQILTATLPNKVLLDTCLYGEKEKIFCKKSRHSSCKICRIYPKTFWFGKIPSRGPRQSVAKSTHTNTHLAHPSILRYTEARRLYVISSIEILHSPHLQDRKYCASLMIYSLASSIPGHHRRSIDTKWNHNLKKLV